MIDTNYSIESLEYLLDYEALSERYYPLIKYKRDLMDKSKKFNYKKKEDLEKLTDIELTKLGLEDEGTIKLLRRFLKMYDSNPNKFKEIEKLKIDQEEYNAYKELYYLPGVKYTRAHLYFLSGYKSLKDIASSNVNDILKNIEETILKNNLSCILPFPKEVRTHIAVSKAFLMAKDR